MTTGLTLESGPALTFSKCVVTLETSQGISPWTTFSLMFVTMQGLKISPWNIHLNVAATLYDMRDSSSNGFSHAHTVLCPILLLQSHLLSHLHHAERLAPLSWLLQLCSLLRM